MYFKFAIQNCRRLDLEVPEVRLDIASLKRQGETQIAEVPIFDQHIDFLKNVPLHWWLLPLGVFTLGLRYRVEIFEQLELINGVVSNILQSVTGKFIHQKLWMQMIDERIFQTKNEYILTFQNFLFSNYKYNVRTDH